MSRNINFAKITIMKLDFWVPAVKNELRWKFFNFCWKFIKVVELLRRFKLSVLLSSHNHFVRGKVGVEYIIRRYCWTTFKYIQKNRANNLPIHYLVMSCQHAVYSLFAFANSVLHFLLFQLPFDSRSSFVIGIYWFFKKSTAAKKLKWIRCFHSAKLYIVHAIESLESMQKAL